METTLEHRKLSIVEHLAEVQDEALIRQIENLLVAKTDFWDSLSENAKTSVNKGLRQLQDNERTEYGAFMQAYFDGKGKQPIQ